MLHWELELHTGLGRFAMALVNSNITCALFIGFAIAGLGSSQIPSLTPYKWTTNDRSELAIHFCCKSEKDMLTVLCYSTDAFSHEQMSLSISTFVAAHAARFSYGVLI